MRGYAGFWRAGWLRRVWMLWLWCCVSGAALANDQLRIGIQLEPPGLDPTSTAAATAGEITYANVFEGLTVADGKGQLRPRLATGWTLSPDGLRYEFHLREGVHFHDGTAFNAAVAVWSLQRILQPSAQNPQREWFTKIRSVQAEGPNKLVVQLSSPDALLPFALALPAAVMVHPDTAASNATHPVGTGPFRFVRWHKTRLVQLERQSRYWGKRPVLRQVQFLFLHSTAETENMLAEGLVDGLNSVTKFTQHFTLRPDYRLQHRLFESKMILAINNARPPFNDVRVRRALSHAINREQMSTLYGADLKGRVIGSHFSPSHPAYVDLAQRYPYDPERARTLLAQAGVRKGHLLALLVPPTDYGRYGGLMVASALEAVGFRVELVPTDWERWMNQVFKQRDYELTLIMHVEPMDLNIYARDDYYFNYQNTTFKDIWHQVLAARDQSELYRLLGAAQRQVAEDAVNVFLFMRPERNLMHKDLRGMWESSPIPSFVLEDLYWAK